MVEKWFLSQIKRATDGTYTKGVVVHDTKDNALNGFHAYFGAYGYGKCGLFCFRYVRSNHQVRG